MSCWASQRANISDYKKQLVMACSKVTQDLHKFVTNYMKGSVKLIACGIEAVVWNEVPVVSVTCTKLVISMLVSDGTLGIR